MYCNILVTKPFDQYFTYKYNINQKIKKGSIIVIPFGKKKDQLGVVYEVFATVPKKIEKLHIKEIPIKTIYADERSQLHVVYAIKFFFITIFNFLKLNYLFSKKEVN